MDHENVSLNSVRTRKETVFPVGQAIIYPNYWTIPRASPLIIEQPMCPFGNASRCWANASACRLQVSLSLAVLCQVVSHQYLFTSSVYRLEGLPCRRFLSYGLQVVKRDVHRSMRLMRRVQDHYIFLTVLIMSMTFVLSLTRMLALLSS